MQVAKTEDTITHAVIGGSAAIDFKVAESNFLMQMLSSSLYQRPREAVVRETMCNAWDAHIDSGRTDTPIEVTLSPTKLIIKDFGKGIPRELIGEIYGTYGASTKTHDANQTGGFGLGSKSPFAVGDHFNVCSCHDGTKTIYAMSKSNAEVEGKPGIIPIVSVPTTESGVTVTIDITALHYNEYNDLIKMVAFNGDISCKLNGKLLPTLSFKNQSNNWIITTESLHTRYSNTREGKLFVRYGNVVYPIQNHVKYATQYKTIERWLDNKIDGRNHDGYKLVLKARPDSLSIQPSREGLNMSDFTLKNLTTLLEEFLPTMELYSMPLAYKILDEGMKQIVENKNLGYLLQFEDVMPHHHIDGYVVSEQDRTIRDIEGLTRRILTVSYPNDADFRKRHRELKREGLFTAFPEDRQFYKHFLDACAKQAVGGKVLNAAQKALEEKRRLLPRVHRFNASERTPTAFYRQHILRPLIQKIRKQPSMFTSNLYMYDSYSGAETFKNPRKRKLSSMEEILHLRDKVIILYFGKANIDERINKFPYWQEGHRYSHKDGTLMYCAQSQRKDVDQIRQFFYDEGYTILDLTVDQPWDAPKPKKVGKELYGPPAPPKKRPSVFVALKHVYHFGKYRVDNAFRADLKDPFRIENPDCYVRIEPSRSQDRNFGLGIFDTETSIAITQWLGERCVVVRNETDENKLSDAGIPTVQEFVTKHVIATVQHPRFEAYWMDDLVRNLGEKTGGPSYEYDDYRQVGILLDDDTVRSMLGLSTFLSSEDKMILHVWRSMSRRHYDLDKYNGYREALAHVSKLPTNPRIVPMAKELRDNPFVGLLFGRNIEKMLADEPERIANMLEAAIL
jgi:hypothetical protein